MNILFVHTIGKKKYGGGERWVVNAAGGMHDHGHDVILAGSKNSVLLEEARHRGVKTLNFSVYSDFNFFKAWRLSRIIRDNNIDVLICKGRELAVSGLAARWSGRNPVLIRRSGSPPPTRSLRLVLRTQWFVHGVITNTQTIQEIYHQNGFTEENFVKIIYNGLTLHDELPPYNFADKFPGKLVVLCIGRVVAHKGYFFLIDAIPEILKKFPSLLFYVLGDGRDKERLEKYAREKGVADKIVFAGYIHQPIPYIKGCDFFLHPSLYEGMPNAPMEAMAYGKPVIMTRVNGAEELSNNGEYALLIPPSDSDAIANAVVHLMENRENQYNVAAKAQSFVRDKFGMKTMIRNLETYILDRKQKMDKAK